MQELHGTSASASDFVLSLSSDTPFSIEKTPAAWRLLMSVFTVSPYADHTDGRWNTDENDAALCTSADATRCCRSMRSKSVEPSRMRP